MNIRHNISILCIIIAAGIFCTEPLNPLDIKSNAGIKPQSLTDSTFMVGDTVAITIHMNLPHMIDTIVVSMHDQDSIIPCGYERDYSATLGNGYDQICGFREINEGDARWNFSTYQDSVHEGDTLRMQMRPYYTKPMVIL